MVLFLRRTAAATFPAMRFTESATLPPGDLDSTGVNRCTTPALALFAGANASFAHVDAVASMQAGASAADVQMSVTSIVDGVPFDLPHLVNPIVTVPAGQWRQASVIASFRPLFPGTSTVWRIDLVRAAGSATTGELTALRCQIKVVSQMAPL
jgi:hypothetical protein